MTFDTVLGIAGLLLAVYSVLQSKRASQIATEARETVRKSRQTSDLSRLNGCLDLAIQEIKIYGPVTSAEKLRGVDRHKIAEKIQDFVLSLRDCLGQFSNSEKRKAAKLCEDITALLAEFGDESRPLDEVRSAGQNILYKLSGFSSELKASLNKKIERG